MSCGVLASVVATIAAIATVHAFTPPSGQGAVPSQSGGQVAQEQLSPVSGCVTPPSLEANRSPIPILFAHRPGNEPISSASSDDVSRDGAAPITNGVSSQRIARAAIEHDGYKGLRSLRRRSDDLWNARTLRGWVEIEVTVDPAGNVTVNRHA